MQLSHEPQDLKNSKKYFCRVKIFRCHHPGAGSRFSIALRVWLLPRQSLPLRCQLAARPGGGAIGKQRQAPVSCSAVDKLRSNSKLTLVHRQRLVEKRSLHIKKCEVEDGGTISAKTNVDCVTTKLLVKCKFPSNLSDFEQCK